MSTLIVILILLSVVSVFVGSWALHLSLQNRKSIIEQPFKPVSTNVKEVRKANEEISEKINTTVLTQSY